MIRLHVYISFLANFSGTENGVLKSSSNSGWHRGTFLKLFFFLKVEDILEFDKNESDPKEKDVPIKEKCENEKPNKTKWIKDDSDDEGKKESSLFRCITKKKKVI